MIHDLSGKEIGEEYVPKVKEEIFQEVFSAADWAVREQVWEKLEGTQAFVIIDPVSGVRQTASLCGALGEFCALQLYQPSEGTLWFDQMQRTQGGSDELFLLGQFEMRLFGIEFLDSEEMQGHDYDLNVRFAPEAWDEFEHDVIRLFSIHPGQLPWFAEEEELECLRDGLLLLRRFCEVDSLTCGVHPYPDSEEGVAELPTYYLPEGGRREVASDWRLRLEVQPPLEAPEREEPPEASAFLKSLSGYSLKKGARWEVGAVYGREPLQKHGRPVFSCLVMVVDSESGAVIGEVLDSAAEPRALLLRDAFLGAVQEAGFLPEVLGISTEVAEEAFRELEPVAGVGLDLTSPNLALREAIRAFYLASEE